MRFIMPAFSVLLSTCLLSAINNSEVQQAEQNDVAEEAAEAPLS